MTLVPLSPLFPDAPVLFVRCEAFELPDRVSTACDEYARGAAEAETLPTGTGVPQLGSS